MGRCLIRQCVESNYILCFDKDEGTFIREGIDGKSPFWNVKGPELLDISITNYCERECEFCYRASNKEGKHISLDDYEKIISQAKDIGVLQVALGGGNPNQHPQFEEILKITRQYGIIPSYTTNGQGMTDSIYQATKNYCGAIAVSLYDSYDEVENIIDDCNEYGIKVNIHFMLNNNTIGEAIDFLENEKAILKKINAVVFLNYKHIHTSKDIILKASCEIKELLNLIKKVKECKIGFDSCMISYLTLVEKNILLETMDYCEAARFSAFISEDLILYPCSFYNDTTIEGIDLNKHSLQYGWQEGKEFKSIREKLMLPGIQNYPISKCNSCNYYEICHGGCPVFDINMCRG